MPKSGRAFDLELVDHGHEGGLAHVHRFEPVNIDEDALVQIGDPGAKICGNCRGTGEETFRTGLGKGSHKCATCGGSGAV